MSVAAILATGVKGDGRRDGLGLGLGPSEARECGVEFLRHLVCRGLQGVQRVISDAHDGLKAAIASVLNATWPRGQVHLMRHRLSGVPNAQPGRVAAAVRPVVTPTDPATAGETQTVERRYFISSLTADAPRVAQAVRGHGGIETRLHGRWDGVFGDDASRIRHGNAPAIMTSIRHRCLNLLDREPSCLNAWRESTV